ncbi:MULTISPECIES: DUF3828 domain-containing protein [Pseudomonas]|uniref:DUF3828 domain-containing protein n=2 Tax=Pseudomonas TaxID=286 RepID=A0A9Q6IG08_9PSED|nr:MULTISPECIES: DUF3828 domain-containing protein [Pseudomonas]MBS7559217.1 DUF3828 domain-containing protein [Pseudomonas sp. RC4D1]MBW8356154.1 YbjP/YqhG family protein [Pseudomonas sp.]MCO7578310.1 YbjP/YqhG family protein [Pseudomonas protegens]MCO7584553.1 YbjP/YqhG family protein [Pseudomonas chlororaphis]MCO7601396.1 YbjP/YqhG family protein [Pseudomonas chlororaphis]
MRMLFCSLLAAVAMHQSVALADCASSPKPATQAFYSWYLQTFSEDKDPLTDNVPEMKKYVSDSLIAKIKKQMASPDGLEEDYFLKAQDYMDEWLTQIKVSEPQIQGSSAKEQVTLGSTPDTTQIVDVRMIKDKGCWKIDEVLSTADQSD